MANIVQINLLENKTVQALWGGRPIEYEGGYRIIAGEKNATQFELTSVPKDYEFEEFTITGYNAGKEVATIEHITVGQTFTLPVGMAVAGYAQLNIECQLGEERVLWVPIKLKITNTMPDWSKEAVKPFESFLAEANEAESAREAAENEREQAESERKTAETKRESNETKRNEAETNRENAEKGRETAENERQQAEAQRQTNESGRISAEEQRGTDFSASQKASNQATERANAAADNIEKLLDSLPNEVEVKNKDGSTVGLSILRFIEF